MADNSDANGSQAGQGGQQGSTNQSQADTNTSTQSQADTSNQTKTNQPNLTIEDALKIIEDLRKEQASNRNKLRNQEAAQAKAEEERLKQQGEFKTLAEQREAELNAVKPRYDRLTELTKVRFAAETKEWPKEVKDLLPEGENVDAVELAEAIEKYRPLVAKLAATQQQQRQQGIVRSPLPAGQQTGPKTADDYYKEFQRGRPF